MNSKSFVLGNGMRLYSYYRQGLESIGIAVGVRYGSIDDGERVSGAAHYLEHMLFKGTAKRSAQQIKREIRGLGLSWNAFTTFETTVYYMQGYSVYLDDMLDILSDLIANSTLPEREFELERGPVINESLIHKDNPRFFFYDNFGRALFSKHPAMRPVGGSKESISRITRSDLLNIYNSYYTPGNMVIALYGNVDPAKAREKAQKYFGGFSRAYKELKRPVAREAQVKREIVIKKKSLKQARIGIGFKALPCQNATNAETAGMMVLSKMLSYSLFDEVRDKNGLSYDPSADYYPFSTFSFIGAQAGVEPKDLERAKKIILKEFARLESGKINEDEVERVKRSLSAQYKMQREDSLSMANSIASYSLIAGDYRFAEKLPTLIERVTAREIKKYAKRYIKASNYSAVLLVP
ncbi:MAG: pitrilysin family protein [Candidatus Micrarchaeaceae archaeon]